MLEIHVYARTCGASWERIFAQVKCQVSDRLCQWRDFEDSVAFLKIKFISWSSHTMCMEEWGRVNKLYSWIFNCIRVYSDGSGSCTERCTSQREPEVWSPFWPGAPWLFGAIQSFKTFFVLMTQGVTHHWPIASWQDMSVLDRNSHL